MSGKNKLTVNKATLMNVMQAWLCSDISGQRVIVTSVKYLVADDVLEVYFEPMEDVKVEDVKAAK
jgi:hypothetical protein